MQIGLVPDQLIHFAIRSQQKGVTNPQENVISIQELVVSQMAQAQIGVVVANILNGPC